MKHGMDVGLGPGHIVLDGDPAPPPKGAQPLPNFRTMSQTGGFKMSFGIEEGPRLGHIVLDGNAAPSPREPP